MYMPLIDHLICNTLLEWSITEPRASATLVGGHFEHLTCNIG